VKFRFFCSPAVPARSSTKIGPLFFVFSAGTRTCSALREYLVFFGVRIHLLSLHPGQCASCSYFYQPVPSVSESPFSREIREVFSFGTYVLER